MNPSTHPRVVPFVLGFSVCVIAGTLSLLTSEPDSPENKVEEKTASTFAPAELPVMMACNFENGERRAYQVDSNVEVSGVSDAFGGLLDLEVIEVNEQGAMMRAAFTELELTQSMTRAADRSDAASIEAAPFFIQMDSRCGFTRIGFPEAWDTSARQLVVTVLRAQEIILPEDRSNRWETAQRDGGGVYKANYIALKQDDSKDAEIHIRRQKVMYTDVSESREFGFELSVLGARTTARFDQRQGVIESVRGEEKIRLALPGGQPQVLAHRFSMERRDVTTANIAFASLEDADFRDALDLVNETTREEPADPSLAGMECAVAMANFHSLFDERGKDAVLPAARFLARWLRANPELAGQLLDELRQGKFSQTTHAALFLAIEMAGTEQTRDVLLVAMEDAELSELNRARAASALADHGEPTEVAMNALLERAREDRSSMVSTVSRLGLGTMAGRAEGELGEELHALLGAELDAAESRSDAVAAIDAIGNAADDRFVPKLTEQLAASEPSVRAHAAEALGRMSPEVARDTLVGHLEAEQDPQVVSSTLDGLAALDRRSSQLTDEDIALATAMLATPNAHIRGRVITWLGQSAARAEVRAVLAAHFHEETDPSLKMLIGKFVSASEIRNGVN